MSNPDSVVYAIGRQMAENLLDWDLYESPEKAFHQAAEHPWLYNLTSDDRPDFLAGVKDYLQARKP